MIDRSPATEFILGVRDQLPILLGIVPFGLIFGALAIAVGIPPLEAQAFSILIFAGSSQFIAVGLIEEGIPAILIILTILIVNARHVLYSASMASYYAHLPAPWKIGLSWLLTDEAYVTTQHRYQQDTRGNARWYALGTGLTLWGTWQVSTALGILAGASIPPDWPLSFALPLTFLALLIPQLIDQPSWAAALVAALSALLLAPLPFRLGWFIAALLGIAAGLLVEQRNSRLVEESP